MPAAIGCAALALLYRPSILDDTVTRRVDLWSLVAIGAMLLQALPLPRAIVRSIDPAAEAVERGLVLIQRSGMRPISIDVTSTLSAALLCAGTWLFFATARTLFQRRGVRTVTRTIAAIGLVLSAIALAQNATAHGLMYWRWRPTDEGPEPFGPFVNRNHFATWAVMTVPLIVGYLVAHATAHPTVPGVTSWRVRIAAALDARAWLLIASATMLIVGLAASLSRSGLLGLAGAFVSGAWLSRSAPGPASGKVPRRRAGAHIAILAALALLAVATQVGPAAMAERFGASRAGIADRVAIWRDTLPIVRDFWLTGTGAGTYLTSMAVYQRSNPGVIYNQAHNHYLQIAAEGGVLVGLPVLLTLSAFASAAFANLSADRSGMYWIRAGAAAGLVGVAVQSVWETGLTTPANAALAAVLAAMLVHSPVRAGARA